MTRRHDHCPECGVSAGLVCRDLDDKPAVETCDGRPLLPLHDSVERTKVSNHHGVAKSKAQINRHKKGLEIPVHVPCSWCGTLTKLLGGAVNTGSTYCPGDACQRAKVRLKSRARIARAKAIRLASPMVERQCGCCGVDFVAATPTQLYCGTTCRKRAEHRRERQTTFTETPSRP